MAHCLHDTAREIGFAILPSMLHCHVQFRFGRLLHSFIDSFKFILAWLVSISVRHQPAVSEWVIRRLGPAPLYFRGRGCNSPATDSVWEDRGKRVGGSLLDLGRCISPPWTGYRGWFSGRWSVGVRSWDITRWFNPEILCLFFFCLVGSGE